MVCVMVAVLSRAHISSLLLSLRIDFNSSETICLSLDWSVIFLRTASVVGVLILMSTATRMFLTLRSTQMRRNPYQPH